MLAVIADPVFDRTDERFKTVATNASGRQQTENLSSDDARSIEHLAEKSDDKSVTTRRLEGNLSPQPFLINIRAPSLVSTMPATSTT